MAKTATDPGYAACPIRNIVDRFGDKWSLLVLYNLHTGGRLRFSEIHRRMTDISQKMLTSTLRRLEQDGLLSRTVYPEVPPRVEYSLTPVGQSLRPILEAMYAWGKAYMENRGEEPTCGMYPPKDGAIERRVEQLKAAQFQNCCGE